jgi:hypothetical protein
MSQVTIEAIEAKQAELAALIASFKATPMPPSPPARISISADITLDAGERYAGVILGDDGQVSHHLVLLPSQAEELAWDDALEWAERAGGALPTRREQSLLFANLKAEFEGAWYWSSEPHATDGSYAWYQTFGYGYQDIYHKSYEGRCRAVRRIPA